MENLQIKIRKSQKRLGSLIENPQGAMQKNLTNYLSPQICRFAICRNNSYLRTALRFLKCVRLQVY